MLIEVILFLLNRIREIVNPLSLRVRRLVRRNRREFNIDVFSNPQKYMVRLSIEKIVADTKVNPEAVEKYKQKIKRREKIEPLIVVKHPKFELYAVLDGHHRYYAYLELGRKRIDCALAGDFSSVIFYLTEHGFFQPNPQGNTGTQKIGLQLHENIEEFLHYFLKEPKEVRSRRKI